MGMPVAPSFSQTGFRFRNDDGSQTTATWKETLNTDATIQVDEVFRVRIRVQQTVANANDALDKAFKVRFSHNEGAYADVGPGVAVEYGASAFVNDGNSTTNQMGGTGTFVAGRIDNNGDTGTITFATDVASWTELEFILRINSGVAVDGDTLDFRVYDTADVGLATYTVTARAIASTSVFVNMDATEIGNDRALVLLTDPPWLRFTEIVPDGTNAVRVKWVHENRPADYVPGDRDERWPF